MVISLLFLALMAAGNNTHDHYLYHYNVLASLESDMRISLIPIHVCQYLNDHLMAQHICKPQATQPSAGSF